MSLVDVFQRYGVPVQEAGHRHVREGWEGVDCPNCSPGSGKFRLGFEIATGRCICWVCGRTDPADVISRLCGISLSEAITIIRGSSRRYVHQERESRGKLVLPDTCDLLPAHEGYLERRGFDPAELVRLWGIRGIGPAGRLKWRIFIPIHDPRGKVVSWTTRAISKTAGVRYISAAEEEEAIPHKDLLYGAHLARHSVVIVEGPIDSWTIGPGAVATFGLGFSAKQMVAMAGYPQRTICFDSQPDAQKRAVKLCRDLAAMPGVTELVELESGKDANEADPDEIQELRERYLG